jgi:hypothetical protein
MGPTDDQQEEPKRSRARGRIGWAAIVAAGLIVAGAGAALLGAGDPEADRTAGGEGLASEGAAGTLDAKTTPLGGTPAVADPDTEAATAPPALDPPAGLDALDAGPVAKEATLSIDVPAGEFGDRFARAAALAERLGGFVASSHSALPAPGAEAPSEGTIVLRVPAERFAEALRELEGLGRLRHQEMRGEEVGGQLADLDARLRNLRAQEEAIRALMGRATTVGETLEVQRHLAPVREQIERLAAEQAQLQHRVDLATISVHLRDEGAPAAARLRSALGQAVAGAEAVVAGMIVVVGYAVPLALVLGAAWLAVRSARRGRRVPPAPAATAATEP